MSSFPTFSKRLAMRMERWREKLGEADAAHKRLEQWRFRSRRDAESLWRCCPLWHRALFNKWNSREFALVHGCRVPDLYWCGASSGKPPIEALPSHFVIRPVFGHDMHSVMVIADEREITRGEQIPRSQLQARLPRSRDRGVPIPILIEEFVRSPGGEYRLPVEYKCHAFGETVAAIEVIERAGLNRAWHRFYTPDWKPFEDPMNTCLTQKPIESAPPNLERLLRLGSNMGGYCGTYIRFDFFATDRGWVFNEVALRPAVGRNFTPFCDEFFGRIWAEKHPDAV
jgi:hypothetical protein